MLNQQAPHQHDDIHTRYLNIVASDSMNNDRRVTIHEGTLHDGRKFYFKYRFGVAILIEYVNRRYEQTRQEVAERVSHDSDNALTIEEYRRVFLKLHQRIADSETPTPE